MKIGFVFPGQGAQSVGMGKDLYENYEEVQEAYKRASKILNIDIAKLTFESTEEELSATKNTQITILIMCLGILDILKKEKIEAEISAGLSLGEYTALIYSDVISFEQGVQIVKKRGELMQQEVPNGDWCMAAVLGLEDEKIENICKCVSKGFVVPANYNCTGQVVVSGEKCGIEEVMNLAKEAGAKRVVELKTSGPFHTEKLKGASDKLSQELEKIEINNSNKVVVKNLDGTPYNENDDVRNILAQHVVSPVKFTQTICYMLDAGVDTFVEIGPRKNFEFIYK